jgi:hypothetical protein
MIIDETHVGRYVFILDINDAKPFQGIHYASTFEETRGWYRQQLILQLTGTEIIERFMPMLRWLEERTTAFRLNAVRMSRPHDRDVTAISVEIPEELGVLFRLFWYD